MSLCRQLRAVNRQISEQLRLRTERDVSAVPRRTAPRISRMVRAIDSAVSPGEMVDPGLLVSFPAFRTFTVEEAAELLRSMQRWDVPRGTLLFKEGDAGTTCFIVLRGLVDASVRVRGQAQLLAQHGPGSIFGQESLIGGEARSVSCSVRRDAQLAEIDADSCERLLNNRSGLALKLLAGLNRGLVAALRSADRQLMRLNGDHNRGWTGERAPAL